MPFGSSSDLVSVCVRVAVNDMMRRRESFDQGLSIVGYVVTTMTGRADQSDRYSWLRLPLWLLFPCKSVGCLSDKSDATVSCVGRGTIMSEQMSNLTVYLRLGRDVQESEFSQNEAQETLPRPAISGIVG